MNVAYDMVVDFTRPNKTNVIEVSEGDANSRVCRFVLLNNKQAFDMIDVTSAVVRGVKSDGSVVYGDATILIDEDGNKLNQVEYTIPKAVTDTAGKTTMTITLSSSTGERITSFEYYVQTRNALYNEDDYISDADLSGFRDLLNRSIAAIETVENLIKRNTLPNPFPLNMKLDAGELSYDGSEEYSVELTDLCYVKEDEEPTETDVIEDSILAQCAEYAAIARRSAEEAVVYYEDLYSKYESLSARVSALEGK